MKHINTRNSLKPLYLFIDQQYITITVFDSQTCMQLHVIVYNEIIRSVEGTVDHLITPNRAIDGHKLMLINDVVVTGTGMIYVTDSSAKWRRAEYHMLGLELNPDGRS